MKNKESKVSYFESYKHTTKKQLGFKDYVRMVHTGIDAKHRAHVTKLRRLFPIDQESYRRLKEKTPLITTSGVFKSGRSANEIIKHSGVIALDVDYDKKYPGNTMKALEAFIDSSALCWHRSLSGIGLVIYYRIPASTVTHGDSFRFLSKHLLDKFGLTVDKGTIDFTRARYISYDPNVVYQPKAPVILGMTQIEKPKYDDSDLNETQKSLEEYTDLIVKSKIDITSKYADWILLGAVYYSVFDGSSHGLELFDKISKLYNGYDSDEVSKKYNSFKGKHTNPAGVGSVVHLMKQYNIPITGPVIKRVKSSTKKPEQVHVDSISSPDYYCTVEEQRAVMIQTVIAPFVPINIRWLGKEISCCTGTVLVGQPSTGKSAIQDLVKQLFVLNDVLKHYLEEKYMGAGISKIKDDAEREKKKKQIDQRTAGIGLVLSFKSSDAAILGSLSEVNRLLLYTNEIDSMISSSKTDYNAGRSENLRQLLEGEWEPKMLKKDNRGGEKTFFTLKDIPYFSLLAGGVPDTIRNYFGKNRDNGLSGRMTFLCLPEVVNFRSPRVVDFPELGLTVESVLNAMSTKPIVIEHDHEYCVKKMEALQSDMDEHFEIARGVRNCVKRAAIQFSQDKPGHKALPNSYLDFQFKILDKSLAFTDTFKDSVTDVFGNSTLELQNQQARGIEEGRLVKVQNGVIVSAKTIQYWRQLKSAGKSIREISKITGSSRNTINKYL